MIHRDIKPENVLVSRLGVIKLCDFGFARPYLENETFTDYVATRWYRSPELLVGDPRYGKEVDIWAVGCLYSEMMTGEPLFPGESDIDQLFQIVRVLGKLNPRHQILIVRNAMFKGMKQEQNSSLIQLFPEWNRDSLDFLTQCLKMDGVERPDTQLLLKHDLFQRDNFIENFMAELKAKLAQEMQVNPLLKRIHSYGSGRKGSDEKKPSQSQHKKSGDDVKTGNSKDSRGQINLSLLPSQLLSSLNKQNRQNGHYQAMGNSNDQDAQNADEMSGLSLSSLKQFLGGNVGTNTSVVSFTNANHNQKTKQIRINNLVFKENAKRVLSAKPQKSNEKLAVTGPMINQQNNFDLQIQPPSPVQFQSLQSENFTNSNEVPPPPAQSKRLSPVAAVNGLSINGSVPQYFSHKRSSNILLLQQMVAQKAAANQLKQNHSSNQLPASRTTVITKRERERDRNHQLLDVSLMSLGGYTTGSVNASSHHPVKEPSPRTLPPPPWLTGNLKITSHGKTTQIGNGNGKRRITDWKSVGINNNGHGAELSSSKNHNGDSVNGGTEFILPNCPGATLSPYKSSQSNSNAKKKLSPMPNFSPDNHMSATPVSLIDQNPLSCQKITLSFHFRYLQRNFSASSDHINET